MSQTLTTDPRFDGLRNAIYHTERRNFFDLLNRGLNFLIVFLGASVAVKAAAHARFEDYFLELGVVLVATLQLVFDFGSRARTHEFLQKRYYELVSELEACGDLDEETCRKWSAKLMTIAADEPMA